MLNYNMDVEDKSEWVTHSLNPFTKKLPFYCSESGNFYAKSDFFTERDTKDAFWLVFTVDGEGVLLYDDSEILLTAGSCFLVDCRKYQHYSTSKHSRTWHHYWAHVDGDGVREYCSQLDLKNMTHAIEVSPDTEELFREILLKSKESTTFDYLNISLTIHNILNNLYVGKTRRKEEKDLNRENILAVAKYLRTNYEKDLCLDNLADIAHMSKYHFSRLFKKYISTSPYDYLLHYRITRAQQMLCTSQKTVGEIAEHTGFGSETNFCAQFKRLTGMTPSVYRKEHYSIFTI